MYRSLVTDKFLKEIFSTVASLIIVVSTRNAVNSHITLTKSSD